jgi:hypothetical protein
MRTGVVATVAAAAALLVSVPAEAVVPSQATAALSTAKAGARPVAVTLRFPALLVCGWLKGTVSVTFPRAAGVPRRIAAPGVRLAGEPAAQVAVSGKSVAVTAAHAGGVTCHSMVLTDVLLTFTRAAQLRNPAVPGRYSIGIAYGTGRSSAVVDIRR